MDGFDQYNFTDDQYRNQICRSHWSEAAGLNAGGGSTVTPFSRGASHLLNNDSYDYMYKYDLGDYQTIAINFRAKFDQGGWNNDNIVRLVSSNGNTNIRLVGTGVRTLEVQRGTNEETFGSVYLRNYRWYHFELKVYIHPTAGTVEFRVNGETIFSKTSQNTKSTTGDTDVSSILLGHSQKVYYDSFIVHDGTADTPRTDASGFLGPIEIITLFPNGDATPNDWTRSTGTNGWEIVDNPIPSLVGETEDYLLTSTATDAEKFNFTTFPTREGATGSWQIKGVMAMPRVGLQNPGSATLKLTVGSNVQTGLNIGAGANKWIGGTIYEYSTGTTDWTESNIDALTVEVELE
jgi:hypothetical protein